MPSSPARPIAVPLGAVRRQIAGVLAAWGMPPALLETTVEAMLYADVSGIDSHGLSMLMMYGTLTGASFSPVRKATRGAGAPDDIGHLLVALDPRAFRDAGAFEDDADAVLDALHRTPCGAPFLLGAAPRGA